MSGTAYLALSGLKGMLSDYTSGIMDNVDAKVKSTMKAQVAGKKLYPKAEKDLLQHYFTVQEIGGPTYEQPISSPVGLFTQVIASLGKEVYDGMGIFKNKGATAGFSVDDLGADWAAIMNMPFDEAYNRGMFTHTETIDNMEGIGQGIPREVLKKLEGTGGDATREILEKLWFKYPNPSGENYWGRKTPTLYDWEKEKYKEQGIYDSVRQQREPEEGKRYTRYYTSPTKRN